MALALKIFCHQNSYKLITLKFYQIHRDILYFYRKFTYKYTYNKRRSLLAHRISLLCLALNPTVSENCYKKYLTLLFERLTAICLCL